MRRQLIMLVCFLVIGLFGLGCQAQTGGCPTKPISQLILCDDGTQSRENCNAPCCYRGELTQGPKCFRDPEFALTQQLGGNARSIASLKRERDNYVSEVGVPSQPSPQEIQSGARALSQASGQEAQAQLGQDNANVRRSGVGASLVFAFLLGGSSFLESNLFPKCPVHVKYCYRTQCGNRFLNNNPRQCLSDPTCCYDYSLAFMRKILGPGFQAHTPLCYYGAISQQWKYVTGFFRPWNPWYTSFILDAFAPLFNTNAFSSGSQFACSLGGNSLAFPKKAYPVGSKSELECNLVNGCWDEDLPTGSQCYMASDFAQSLFAQFGLPSSVYPYLYTDDPSETQCSANWFDFGPKAYRRLPCGIGPPPPVGGLVERLKWCPISDCCLNYASLNLDAQDLLLLQAITGGGGFGFGAGINTGLNVGGLAGLGGLGGAAALGGLGGGLAGLTGLFTGLNTSPNTLLFYLLQGSSSTDSLEELFCPYRNLFSSSSIFPDLSEFTDGCCEIPDCYHKRKLQGNTGPPRSIPSWSQWSDCSSDCGPGQRTRQCFYQNQVVQSANCGGGPSSEPCTGSNCGPPPQSYSYGGPFVAEGSCSVTCGQGTQLYVQKCLDSFGQEVQVSFCFGQQPTQNRPCPQPPCQVLQAQWGNWRQGDCSSSCGGGRQQWSRPCLSNGQEVSATLCSGTGTATGGACNTQPCQVAPTYRWDGIYVLQGPCSVTCGVGTQLEAQRCVNAFGQVVSDQFCTGPRPERQVSCQRPPCPVVTISALWTVWNDGPCQFINGRCVRTRMRYCVRPDNPGCMMASSCGGQSQTEELCNAQECFPQG